MNTLRRCHSTVRALMKSCAPMTIPSGFHLEFDDGQGPVAEDHDLHDLVIVGAGHAGTDDNSVLHIPDPGWLPPGM